MGLDMTIAALQATNVPAPDTNITGDDRHGANGHHQAVARGDIARVAFVAVAATLVGFHTWEPFARVGVIGILATLIGGWPIFHEAHENLIARRMTMELSLSLARFSRRTPPSRASRSTCFSASPWLSGRSGVRRRFG